MLICSVFFIIHLCFIYIFKKNIDQRKQDKNQPECDDNGGEKGAEVIDAGEAKVGQLDTRRMFLLYFCMR